MTVLVDDVRRVAGAPPWWSRYVELTLELGIGRANSAGTVVGAWDRSHWDRANDAHWSGLEPTWIAVDPCRIVDLSIARGRERWIDRYGASSLTATLEDPDGWLSWSTDNDDVVDTRIGRPARVTARIVETGDVIPMWRGWIEGLDDTFAPNEVPSVKLTCQDGYAQVAHVDQPEQDPVGEGERSDERVARLLALADWPPQWQALEQGRITVQATNLARQLADDLGVTADSEGGALYSDRDDTFVFRNRDWLRTDPRATNVQAIIGGPDRDFCATVYETTRSGQDIVNDVQFARAGGNMRRFVDTASVSMYRRRTYQRTDFVCETDAQVDVLAGRVLNARSRGQIRVPTIGLAPYDDPAEWRFVCEVDYGWMLQVNYDPQTVVRGAHPVALDTGWSRTVQVQGMEYRISPGGWNVTLRVDDAAVSAGDTWDGIRGWDRALWAEAE
ncbi:MAG TPA: hypothetical protein VH395_09090 [Jatrophihabitantaceae bacterium]|jgi:hypothetical protein